MPRPELPARPRAAGHSGWSAAALLALLSNPLLPSCRDDGDDFEAADSGAADTDSFDGTGGPDGGADWDADAPDSPGDARDARDEQGGDPATDLDSSDAVEAEIDAGAEADGPDLRPPPDPVRAEFSLDESHAARLHDLLIESFPLAESPGAAVAVVVPGEGQWFAGIGMANKRERIGVQPHDRFRLGSITKTFTAATVLLLQEDSLLSLDDFVVAWLPEYAFGIPGSVTVRHLLNHTSGIYNYTDDPTFFGDPTRVVEPDELVRAALEHGPAFGVGRGWGYSNTNFVLAGLIVERATEGAWSGEVRERLLDPLALDDTFIEGAEEVTGGFVRGHVAGGDVTDRMDPSWAWAAGNMISESGDLCEWAEALYRGEALSGDSREALLSFVGPVDAGGDGYGLGTYQRHVAELELVGHTGSTMGFATELFIARDTGACIAVLLNDFLAETEPISEPLWEEIATW